MGQAVTAIHSEQLISTFDIDKPERLNTLFRRYGDQGVGFFLMVNSLGWTKPVAQSTFEHDEEDWIHNVFHSLNTELDPTAGVDITITLEPADLDGGDRFYPRLWDTVMFPNEVTGTIIDIDISTPSAPVLTISPSEVTDNIGAITAGTELIIISNAHSEGSTQPASRVTGVIHYDNDVQIIKETLTATGSEMTNQKWFHKLNQPEGGTTSIPQYYVKGQLDADFRMQLAMDGALLFQKRTTNTIVDNVNPNVTNAPIKTTEGLIPFIERLGNKINYTPGLFTIEKFDEAVKIFEKNFAAQYICCLYGIDINIEIENKLVDYFKDTNIEFARKALNKDLFYGNEGLEATVGFKYLMKGQRMFAFKQMRVFNNPRTYAADGYSTPGLGVMIPMGMKKNVKDQKRLPTFGVRYKQLGAYNRKMEVWNVSGAGTTNFKVIADDIHNYYQRAHIGFHGMAPNQMVLFRPQ